MRAFGIIAFITSDLEEQSKLIKKQDAIIEEMQRYIDNREDIKNRLGDN